MDSQEIDQQMEVFDRFSHPQPDRQVLERINISMQSALRRRRQVRVVLRLGSAGAIAAGLALAVWLGMGLWSSYDQAKQVASLEQLVDQFVTAADSWQLATVTSQLDQQISDLQDQLVRSQSLEADSAGLDSLIDQLEDDLADLADFADSV